MDYARKLHDTDYADVGGRDRMPIYPFIMSLFYDDEMDDDQFLEIGRKVSFLISGVVLLYRFLIFRLNAVGLEAGKATSVVAFTVFAYKAPYFQVEIPFYGVTLVVFVLMLEMLRRPPDTFGSPCRLGGGYRSPDEGIRHSCSNTRNLLPRL